MAALRRELWDSRTRAHTFLLFLAWLFIASSRAQGVVLKRRADVVSDCSTSVSITPGFYNSECRKLCEAGQFDTHDEKCQYEPYQVDTVQDQVFPQGSCYQQWVPGYSDEGFLRIEDPTQEEGVYSNLNDYYQDHKSGLTTSVGLYFSDVATPAECQQLCQEDPDCYFFLHRTLVTPGGNKYQQTTGCLLKNKEMVWMAYKMPMKLEEYATYTDADPRYIYCDLGFTYQCNGGGYTCLGCDTQKVCVWQGVHFLGGTKYCPYDEKADCLVPPTSTTEIPISSTSTEETTRSGEGFTTEGEHTTSQKSEQSTSGKGTQTTSQKGEQTTSGQGIHTTTSQKGDHSTSGQGPTSGPLPTSSTTGKKKIDPVIPISAAAGGVVAAALLGAGFYKMVQPGAPPPAIDAEFANEEFQHEAGDDELSAAVEEDMFT